MAVMARAAPAGGHSLPHSVAAATLLEAPPAPAAAPAQPPPQLQPPQQPPQPQLTAAGLGAAPRASAFVGGGTAFVEEFRVRGNECGPDQRANILTIANLLQEVGGNQCVALWGRADSGFAAMPGMDHLIFVATRMQIRMDAYPKWGDVVRLETWFAEESRLTTRRDWVISDAATGARLGAATSTWVVINAATRKLAKLPEEVRTRWLPLAPQPPRAALPAGETRQKLPDLPGEAALAAPDAAARRGDVDPNGHVNNVCYLAWALEAVPGAIHGNYHLREVEIDFKAECHAGDTVQICGHPLTDASNGNGAAQQLLHWLRKPGGGEVWRARTTWVPKK